MAQVVTVNSPKPGGSATISGRVIIEKFRKGDPDGLLMYKKICSALEIIGTWKDVAIASFLEQFLDLSDILDQTCKHVMKLLCAIGWEKIPSSVLPRFVRLLSEVAVRHLSHTEVVLECAARNLAANQPSKDDDGNLIFVDPSHQSEMFALAHQIVNHVITVFPTSDKNICRIVQRCFPHNSAPKDAYVWYLRNVVQMGEYAPKMRTELWDIVIDQLVALDTVLLNASREQDDVVRKISSNSAIFVMDEEQSSEERWTWSERAAERAGKLDESMLTVLGYLSIAHDKPAPEGCDMSWLHISIVGPNGVMEALLAALEKHLLMAQDVRHVPFIWLHLCSLNESYAQQLLAWLWSVATRPERAQAAVKKAHGAACYLAAFLARAHYVRIETARDWLARMCDWLVSYVQQCGLQQSAVGGRAVGAGAGGARHGLFYAISHAIFVVFSFRYKELVKKGFVEDAHKWGLARIIHSGLDPLKYVGRPVALCFAAISRSLQLVYCAHVIPVADDEVRRPFEPVFPLDTYRLESSSACVSSLMRKFAPLAEHVPVLSMELRWGSFQDRMNGEEAAYEGMDFLDEEMDFTLPEVRSRSNTMTIGSAMTGQFDMYSTSPGLRNFHPTPRGY